MDLRKYFGKEKRPKEVGDDSSCKRVRKSDDYESRRKRNFVPGWKKEFLWLDFDGEKQLMFCKVCREHDRGSVNPFVQGTNLFRKDPIRVHGNTKSHKTCLMAKAAIDDPDSTPMAKIYSKMNQSQCEAMKKLFRTAYYVAKEDMALSKFKGLCELQVANGIELAAEKTYKNDHACRNFIQAVAETQFQDLIDCVRDSRFISILSDGSTDSGIIEQEIVYVRMVHNKQPVTKMVQCKALKHANAAGILEAIDSVMEKVGIDPGDAWSEKVVCANFDGASVMMGDKSGVAARIKQRVPHLVTMHCIAHKLELAVLDVVKDVSYLVVFEETLKSVFKFYYFSPKKRRELKEISDIIEEKLVKFSGLKSTRWLPSRLRCLTAVKRNYNAVVVHMENVASSKGDVKPDDAAKARGIVEEMKTQKFVHYLHFMLDYSTLLSKCSTNFQYDDINITRSQYLIRSTTADLLRLKTTPGDFQQELINNLEEDETGSVVTFKGVKLSESKRPQRGQSVSQPTQQRQWEKDFLSILQKTVDYIDKRFSSLFEEPLSSFSIFDTSLLPDDREELANYGYSELQNLINHFSHVLTEDEIEEIPHEWTDLKIWLSAHRAEHFHSLYTNLLKHESENLRHILPLVEILLTISPSTAICERGFSCMNRVKTIHRTSLNAETLNYLMLISTNGPELSGFCPEKAVKHWFNSTKGGRHLVHKTPTRRVKDKTPSEALSSKTKQISTQALTEHDPGEGTSGTISHGHSISVLYSSDSDVD